MEIIDANVVLRYLLKDHEKYYPISKQIIEQKDVHLPTEVVAEIVYVLEKVYDVPKTEISTALSELLIYPNLATVDSKALRESLEIYKNENIDFVDALLVSYNRVNKDVIYSFDKKVNRLCN